MPLSQGFELGWMPIEGPVMCFRPSAFSLKLTPNLFSTPTDGLQTRQEVWLCGATKIHIKKQRIWRSQVPSIVSNVLSLLIRCLNATELIMYRNRLCNIKLQRCCLLDARLGLSCPSSVKDIISCGKPRGRASPRSYCQKWNTFPYVFATWHTKHQISRNNSEQTVTVKNCMSTTWLHVNSNHIHGMKRKPCSRIQSHSQ